MSDTATEIITLPASLDIAGAADFLDQCKKLQSIPAPLCFDASGVERFTTPCLQVLVAFVKKRTESGLSLSINTPTSAFSNTVKTLGFESFFKEIVTNG